MVEKLSRMIEKADQAESSAEFKAMLGDTFRMGLWTCRGRKLHDASAAQAPADTE